MRVRALARALPAALLGAGAALLLVSCGGSGQGLIPSADAGPLQSDFERVAQEARSGGGSCGGTEAALFKTQQDYGALPPSVNGGLRDRLREGISKLREDALSLCAQPHPQATVTSTTPRTFAPTRTTTTPTVTQTTSTQTAPPKTTPAPTPEGGGTPAPGDGGSEPGPGSGQGPGGSGSGPGDGQGGGGPGGGEGGGSGAGAGAGSGGGQPGAGQ